MTRRIVARPHELPGLQPPDPWTSPMTARAATFALLAALMAGGTALAQPLPPGASPGVPGADAVNPAPGASGPYLGHPGRFYDPSDRLRDLDARLAGLPPHEAMRARSGLHSIHAFADGQRSRHGGQLRDWDRERMTRMMNDLVRRYPDLAS